MLGTNSTISHSHKIQIYCLLMVMIMMMAINRWMIWISSSNRINKRMISTFSIMMTMKYLQIKITEHIKPPLSEEPLFLTFWQIWISDHQSNLDSHNHKILHKARVVKRRYNHKVVVDLELIMFKRFSKHSNNKNLIGIRLMHSMKIELIIGLVEGQWKTMSEFYSVL